MSSNSQVITGSWVKYRPSGYDYSLVKMHRLKLQFWFSSPPSPKKEAIQNFFPSLIKLHFFHKKKKKKSRLVLAPGSTL